MRDPIDPRKDLKDVRASIAMIRQDLADVQGSLPGTVGKKLDRALARIIELDGIIARLEVAAARLEAEEKRA